MFTGCFLFPEWHQACFCKEPKVDDIMNLQHRHNGAGGGGIRVFLGIHGLKVLGCLLFVFLGAVVAQAETAKVCAVCNEPLQGYYVSILNQSSFERQRICLKCALKYSRCYVCGLPTVNPVRTDDGRLLCQEDARKAVFYQKDADNIFYSVKREMHGILAEMGTFKDDIDFHLVDGHELQNIYDPEYENHAITGLEGLTVSHKKDTNHITYSVYVLSGLPENHLAAVCAHEYTHVWLDENIGKGRKLDRSTEEGFCELVAYKMMAGRHDDKEMRIIRANAYTRGQMRALLAAEDLFEFHRLVKWIKAGTDSRMDWYSAKGVIKVANEDTSALFVPAPLPPAPSVLTLKGISGAEQHRFALINDSTFEAQEKGRVRLGQTNVVLRCLEIRSNSVVVQLDGSAEKKELFLRAQ
jgi:Protein DA1